MLLAELDREKRGSKKGIEWALWLYGSMALRRSLKNIFIVSKHRLMRLFQIEEIHQTKKYSVLQNSAVRSYLHITASGNSLRIAGWCYILETIKFVFAMSKSPQKPLAVLSGRAKVWNCASNALYKYFNNLNIKGVKMKKYIVLFLVSITVIIFNSCEKNYPTQNQNQNYSLLKPNVIYLTGLNPENIANPLDSCGYYHNLFLTIFINNTQISAYDTNLYKEAIFDIMGQIGDDNIFGTNRVINQYAFAFYYDSVNGLSNNQIIEKYSINSYIKSKLYNLFTIMQGHTDTLHFNIDSINTIINEIKSWEQLVMQELNYYNYNPNDSIANQLLITSSIVRYSLCYWVTAINDPNSAWRNLFPTNKINPKFVSNNKIQNLETILGVGAALYITGSDASGAIAGVERPKLDEKGQQIKNPDGTPVMETVRGTDGAVLASGNACIEIWNWFKGLFN